MPRSPGIPLIDAEVLREFFEKAEMFLIPEYQARLSDDLEKRCARAVATFPSWPELWDLAPATRRLPVEERVLWEPRLYPLRELLEAADSRGALIAAEEFSDRPKWLVDWITFWSHVANPEVAWWARWVYGAHTETGALLLLLDNPTVLQLPETVATYDVVSDAAQYLSVLLESTRSLTGISSVFRPVVTLAVVYTVYMFTMASWKLTEEFTHVLPPFPVVVRTLLGVNRREGK